MLEAHPEGLAGAEGELRPEVDALAGDEMEAPALAAVQFALAGEQALAEDGAGDAERAAFDEVPIVSDEDVADEVRVIDLHEAACADAQGAEVGSGAACAGDPGERVTAELKKGTEAGAVFDDVVHRCVFLLVGPDSRTHVAVSLSGFVMGLPGVM